MTLSPFLTIPADASPHLRMQTHPDEPRVLHVVPSLHGGGMERALLRLLEAFRRMPAQHAVCVLGGGDADLLGRCQSLAATWILDEPGGGRRSLAGAIRRVVDLYRPDVVHARTTATWFDAARALRGRPDIRLLLGFHGQTTLDKPTLRRQIACRWAARRADAVLAVSRDAARRLHRDWHIAESKLHVIPNGVDTAAFAPPSRSEYAAARTRWQIAPNDYAVLCVANHQPIKALDVLLSAWRQVAMIVPSARLLLAGDGPCRAALEHQADQLRLTESVRFLGRQSDIASLLHAGDLLVLPSRYEASPNCVLEAMACGLPTVAFEVGGMSELIQPNHTGWLLPEHGADPLADLLIRVLLDTPARQRAGQAARTFARAHRGMDAWLAAYRSLYQDLAAGIVNILSSAAAQGAAHEASGLPPSVTAACHGQTAGAPLPQAAVCWEGQPCAE